MINRIIICLVLLAMAYAVCGCGQQFWHPDNRVRIKLAINLEGIDPEVIKYTRQEVILNLRLKYEQANYPNGTEDILIPCACGEVHNYKGTE